MSFVSDVRLAARSFRKTPGFTATAVVTLGLAMALCIAVTVVTNAYLFTQLPYPASERLHWIRYAAPGQDSPQGLERLDWHSLGDVIEHPIAWDLDMFYVLGGENAEAVPGAWVTPGFVEGLGIRPAVGRGFDAQAFERGSANVALISHSFWLSRFGGDASAIGRQFTAYVSDRPQEAERFTVIGVLPQDFWHLNPYTDIFVPLRAETFPYMARLRPGVTAEQAATRIASLVRAGASRVPEGWAPTVESIHGLYAARVRPMLRSIMAAAGLLLLVGCANVAGLLLLRARAREKEIAVRSALGASRGAIVRMLAAEALLLGATAIACAIGVAHALLSWLGPVLQGRILPLAPGGPVAFAMDTGLVTGVAAAGLLTSLVCGLAPVLVVLRANLLPVIQSGGRTATEGRKARRLRAGLIALEIAASLALLSGSALMLRTVVSLVQTDLGIESGQVLIASITLRQSTYPDAPSRLALFERMLARLRETGGVESAALVSSWPLQQPRPQTVAAVEADGRTAARAGVQAVSSDYFATLGIPVKHGRAFSHLDRPGSEPVAIVSETLARQLWPGSQAVGRRLTVEQQGAADAGPPAARVVVGVAADVRQDPGDEDRADVYVPLLPSPSRFVVALVRTSGPPAGALPAMRAAFRDVDPELSLTRARPLQSIVDESRARPQFLAGLLSAFAVMAAFVATVGIYGMIAYAVRQREREVAVRMAIGARPAQVVALFVRQGAVVLAAGLAIGALVAVATGRLLESQLFGVTPRDPLSLALAVAAFGCAGLLAVWWPARRAASTDPAMALKE